VKVTDKTSAHAEMIRVELSYDGNDKLIGRKVFLNGSVTPSEQQVFIYENGQIVLEFDKTGGGSLATADLARRYLWGPAVDQLLADEDVNSLTDAALNQVRWPLTDHLGTPRDWISSSGALLDHAEYDSFGRRLDTDAINVAFEWTARYRDPLTGLQYNDGRWYNPAIQRWMSEDPIGFAGGDGNLGRYVGNGPTMFVDPSGLSAAGKVIGRPAKETALAIMKRRLAKLLSEKLIQIHHVIPQHFFKECNWGDFLGRLGIEKDGFSNILPLPTSRKAGVGTRRSVHVGGHLKSYFDSIDARLKNIEQSLDAGQMSLRDAQQAVRAMQEEIKTGLRNGTISLHHPDVMSSLLPFALLGTTKTERESLANDLADAYVSQMDEALQNHDANRGRVCHYTGDSGLLGWLGWVADVFNPIDDAATAWDLFIMFDYDPTEESPEEYLDRLRQRTAAPGLKFDTAK
jgi:RHS repeat-associated protein